MTDREMERLYQEEPDEKVVRSAEKDLAAAHAGVDLAVRLASRDGEDKQLICDLLCWTLAATRDQHDLRSLVYHDHGTKGQMVTIAYSEGGTSVDVTADSGIAMIRDILRAISR